MTSKQKNDLSDNMLIALRRVIRAVDVHSRSLVASHGLTGPQALVLRETLVAGALTAGELARRVSVSQATMTDIVKRLETRKLVRRTKDAVDKRRVLITATKAGEKLYASAPPLLQETFIRRFAALRDWEQTQMVSTLQRIAEMMDAENLDAAPVLTSGDVGDPMDKPARRGKKPVADPA